MSHGWRLYFLAIIAGVSCPCAAFADSTVITSGSVAVAWDGDRAALAAGDGPVLVTPAPRGELERLLAVERSADPPRTVLGG